MDFEKFELNFPSHQNAVDIFSSRWASDLSAVGSITGTGAADLFVSDPRPKMAAEAFGNDSRRLDGMRILELGPLEGGHSYQLQKLGASLVLGIEANTEAYLKCLIVKELLQLDKCRFLLGDVLKFMDRIADNYDMVFCSGILYHMKDPILLIKSICKITDKCFVWTHYYDEKFPGAEGPRSKREVSFEDFSADYHEQKYGNMEAGNFWGGNTDSRSWMSKNDIVRAFKHFGLDSVEILQDTTDHPHGAAMSLVASRKR